MSNHDWSIFTKKISISADKDAIFSAWVSQAEVEKWFLSKAEFHSKDQVRDRNSEIEVGDTYVWMWHGSDNVAEGEVLENNRKDYLKFTFLGCVVTVEIKEEDGENMIELTQSEIPLDDESRRMYYVGCTRGWTFYMTNLKSILEGGIDLRNKNINLQNVINT